MSIATLEARLRTHPDDREAWIVFGDWLAEHGDPRAALVRGNPSPELLRNKRRLRSRYAPGAPEGRLDWRCGFPVGVTVAFTAGALEALEAWLRTPEAALVSSVRLARGRAFGRGADDDRVHGDAGDAGHGDRDDGGYEDELDEDADDDFDYDPDAAPDLSSRVPADALAELAALDLGSRCAWILAYAEFGPDGVAALGSARLDGVRRLDLRYCRLGDPGAIALAALPALADIEALWLQGNHIGPDGLAALAAAPRHRRFELLDLRDNPITDQGAAAFAGSPWSAADVLHLHLDDIGEPGARALASSPHLPARLRRLWSARCP